MSRLLARRRRVRAAVPQDHAVPLVSGRRSAEQQSGQPPRWSGGDHALGAWHAGPSRLQEQAVPLAGPRRVVLHGLRDILVDDHGRSPRRRLSRPLRSALALTLMEHESCSEIHPRHCRIACGVSADLDTGAERRIGVPRTGRTFSGRGTSWGAPGVQEPAYGGVRRRFLAELEPVERQRLT